MAPCQREFARFGRAAEPLQKFFRFLRGNRILFLLLLPSFVDVRAQRTRMLSIKRVLHAFDETLLLRVGAQHVRPRNHLQHAPMPADQMNGGHDAEEKLETLFQSAESLIHQHAVMSKRGAAAWKLMIGLYISTSEETDILTGLRASCSMPEDMTLHPETAGWRVPLIHEATRTPSRALVSFEEICF